MSYRFGSNLIQTGRAVGAERAAGGESICPSIHPLCSPQAPGCEACLADYHETNHYYHGSACNAGTLSFTLLPETLCSSSLDLSPLCSCIIIQHPQHNHWRFLT